MAKKSIVKTLMGKNDPQAHIVLNPYLNSNGRVIQVGAPQYIDLTALVDELGLIAPTATGEQCTIGSCEPTAFEADRIILGKYFDNSGTRYRLLFVKNEEVVARTVVNRVAETNQQEQVVETLRPISLQIRSTEWADFVLTAAQRYTDGTMNPEESLKDYSNALLSIENGEHALRIWNKIQTHAYVVTNADGKRVPYWRSLAVRSGNLQVVLQWAAALVAVHASDFMPVQAVYDNNQTRTSRSASDRGIPGIDANVAAVTAAAAARANVTILDD